MKRKHPTWDEVQTKYFHDRPEEIPSYLAIVLEEVAIEGDWSAFSDAVRMAAEARGIKMIVPDLVDHVAPSPAVLNAMLKPLGLRLGILPVAAEAAAASQLVAS